MSHDSRAARTPRCQRINYNYDSWLDSRYNTSKIVDSHVKSRNRKTGLNFFSLVLRRTTDYGYNDGGFSVRILSSVSYQTPPRLTSRRSWHWMSRSASPTHPSPNIMLSLQPRGLIQAHHWMSTCSLVFLPGRGVAKTVEPCEEQEMLLKHHGIPNPKLRDL